MKLKCEFIGIRYSSTLGDKVYEWKVISGHSVWRDKMLRPGDIISISAWYFWLFGGT